MFRNTNFVTKNLVASLIMVAALNPVSANEVVKIGFVDTASVLKQFPKAQKAIASLNNSEIALKKKIDSKREEINKARAQKKSETELQMMLEKFRQEIEPQAKKLEEESKKSSQTIEKDLQDAIKEVAKESKLDMILARQAVLYGGTDVSETVVKKLAKKK